MPTADTIRAKWLADGTVLALMAALDARAGKARFVGGCVRNAVMGTLETDIDIATTHPPQESTRRLEAAGFVVKPTGIEHGTITAIRHGRSFEVTTLREDVETDGRHAVVAFTDDWAADAARRDFTMNALYMDLDGGILDPAGGFRDARDGRVRFVGDPALRIAEDALRILRFFRFQAQYGREPIDPDGLEACRTGARLQAKLSGERVRNEVLKLLAAPGAVPVVQAMVAAGILAPLFSEQPDIPGFLRLIELENRLMAGRPDALRRLAALLHPTADGAIDRLRLSNAERDRLLAMRENRIDLAVGPDEFRARLYRLGPERYADAVLMTAAAPDTPIDAAADALAIAGTWTAPRFPIRGADLIKLGLAPGQQLGRILAALEERWIADGMRGDRARCLAWARQAIDNQGEES
jgi:poly(A) polymerase